MERVSEQGRKQAKLVTPSCRILQTQSTLSAPVHYFSSLILVASHAP